MYIQKGHAHLFYQYKKTATRPGHNILIIMTSFIFALDKEKFFNERKLSFITV